MRGRFSMGRVLGFPVDVHFTLLLFLAAVFLLGGGLIGVTLVVLTFASVLLHELGHSVVARRLGIPIEGITLYPFGGMARMAAPTRTPLDEMVVAAAGPAVSLALAVAFGLGWWVTGAALVGHLAWVNALLGGFNLLPALPMDGGRIFRAALARKHGHVKATRIAASVARVAAVGLALLGVFTNPMLLVIAVLVWSMAGTEERAAEAVARRQHVDRVGPSVEEWAVVDGRVVRRAAAAPRRSTASRMVVEVLGRQ